MSASLQEGLDQTIGGLRTLVNAMVDTALKDRQGDSLREMRSLADDCRSHLADTRRDIAQFKEYCTMMIQRQTEHICKVVENIHKVEQV